MGEDKAIQKKPTAVVRTALVIVAVFTAALTLYSAREAGRKEELRGQYMRSTARAAEQIRSSVLSYERLTQTLGRSLNLPHVLLSEKRAVLDQLEIDHQKIAAQLQRARDQHKDEALALIEVLRPLARGAQ